MAAIESLDKDLVLIFIASTINSSIKELKDLSGQSTVELNLDTFLAKMNRLIVKYTESFNLSPIDTKVDKSTLIALIKERRFADFVQVSDDILKIESNAKAFQAILSNIAVTSTLNYAKLLIKNIDDLGIIYRSSMDKADAKISKEDEPNNSQDTINIEKYTIEGENGSGDTEQSIKDDENVLVEANNSEALDIEVEDKLEQDNVELEVTKDIEKNGVSGIKEHGISELNKEGTERTEPVKTMHEEQEDKIQKEPVEKDDEALEKLKDEEKEEQVDLDNNEKEQEEEQEEEQEVEQEEGKEEEQEQEEQEQEKEKEKEKEQEEEQEEKQEEENEENEEGQEKNNDGNQKENVVSIEKEKDQEEQEDEPDILEEAGIQGSKVTKKDKSEQDKTTPVDSKNNDLTPEPKLPGGNTKEELRPQSSRKRSRSLSVSTPQQHKRFQHIAVNLINNIQAHRFSSPFLQPVNAKEAPDYHEVIYEPKDLKNILKSIKLKNDPPEYQLIKQLKRDIMLMLANCIMYNKSDTDLVQLTKSMKNDVNNIFKLFEEAELDNK